MILRAQHWLLFSGGCAVLEHVGIADSAYLFQRDTSSAQPDWGPVLTNCTLSRWLDGIDCPDGDTGQQVIRSFGTESYFIARLSTHLQQTWRSVLSHGRLFLAKHVTLEGLCWGGIGLILAAYHFSPANIAHPTAGITIIVL